MLSDQITSSTSAGKLHFLDLTSVKNQMGDRWKRMADTVERFFDGAVRRNLSAGDTFVRHGELSYLLLFRELSPEEAQIKCHTILEEVCERLFGDQIQKASFRTLVAPLDLGTSMGDDIAGVVDELLERKGKETIFQASASKTETATASSGAGASEANDYAFRYRPIWDATKNVVVTYLCDGRDLKHASSVGTGDQAQPQERQAAFDRHVLKECDVRAQLLHRSGLRVLFGVSVALDTLSHTRLWIPYFRELQSITSAVSRDFAFFVTGIDSGVPNIRLTQELPKLTRLSTKIFCLIEDRGYVGTRFSRTGAHAIGITLSSGEAEASAMGRIAELARQAAEAGLAAFVLGIPSTSIMLHSLGQGIRYLEGPVIRPAVSDPRHAFAQSLEYIYTSGNNKNLHSDPVP